MRVETCHLISNIPFPHNPLQIFTHVSHIWGIFQEHPNIWSLIVITKKTKMIYLRFLIEYSLLTGGVKAVVSLQVHIQILEYIQYLSRYTSRSQNIFNTPLVTLLDPRIYSMYLQVHFQILEYIQYLQVHFQILEYIQYISRYTSRSQNMFKSSKLGLVHFNRETKIKNSQLSKTKT